MQNTIRDALWIAIKFQLFTYLEQFNYIADERDRAEMLMKMGIVDKFIQDMEEDSE